MSDRSDLLLKVALAYAKRNWAVFPVHTPVEGGCSCRRDDCTNIGKHPRTKNGFKDASTDQEQIEKWWGMWPEANIAIACGASGLTVIDVDPRHGGDETFRDLVQRYGEDLTETVIALTGSHGNHYFYAAGEHPIPSSIGAWQGIDIRGHNGYVVAPPSLHENGEEYAWERSAAKYELLPFPDIVETRGPRALAGTPGAIIPVGKRDDTLASLAGTMRRRGMGAEAILAALRIENAERCQPPLPESDLRRIANSVATYEPGKDVIVRRPEFTKTYSKLRMIATKPPSWILTVMGVDVNVATMAVLKAHGSLQTEVAEQTRILVPSLTKMAWEAELGELLRECQVIEAPDDASEEGIVWQYIREHLRRAEEDPKGQGLLEGRPFRRDGTVVTDGAQLTKLLALHNLKMGARDLWKLAREHDGQTGTVRAGDTVKRAWWFPEAIVAEREFVTSTNQGVTTFESKKPNVTRNASSEEIDHFSEALQALHVTNDEKGPSPDSEQGREV